MRQKMSEPHLQGGGVCQKPDKSRQEMPSRDEGGQDEPKLPGSNIEDDQQLHNMDDLNIRQRSRKKIN